MRYLFNDEAAAVIVNAINNTPITKNDHHRAIYSNTDVTSEPTPSDVTFEIQYAPYLGNYYLIMGESILSLSYFSWSNRRRIVKAYIKTRALYTSAEAVRDKARSMRRSEDALNAIIAGLQK